jgi:hypothetical protein
MRIQSNDVTHCVLLVLMLAIVGIATSLLTGCGPGSTSSAGEEGDKTLYTCGMHPQVVQDKPGNCPICGMKLTPIRKPTASARHSGATATGEKKIKNYKSTMTPGETSPTPRKDSMGMDMVPVYEDEAAAAESQTIAVDPATTQTMGIRTATVTRDELVSSFEHDFD